MSKINESRITLRIVQFIAWGVVIVFLITFLAICLAGHPPCADGC